MRTLAVLFLVLVPGFAQAEALSERIADALALPAGASIELDNPRLAAEDGARVENIAWDPRTSRVTATIEGVRVTGKIRRMVDLPVLTRYVAPGEAIGAEDVTLVPIRAERLGQGVAAEAADLVGKTPRRSVRPGEPVRLADIRPPVVVRKGEAVTIVLEQAGMRLSAQGRAAEDGAMGRTLRVSNIRSGKIVDATVAGPGVVKIEVQ